MNLKILKITSILKKFFLKKIVVLSCLLYTTQFVLCGTSNFLKTVKHSTHLFFKFKKNTYSKNLYTTHDVVTNEIAQKIYNCTLTDGELMDLSRKLLQLRIDYWKKKLIEAKGKSEKRDIPLYIQYNSRITPKKMLSHATIMNSTDDLKSAGKAEIKKHRIYGRFSTPYEVKWQASLSLNLKLSSFPPLVLYVLHHELTHIEQYASLYLAHASPSSEYECEREADLKAIQFFHNPYMLEKFAAYCPKSPTEKGYLGRKEFIRLSKKNAALYYAKNPDRKEYDRAEFYNWTKLFNCPFKLY